MSPAVMQDLGHALSPRRAWSDSHALRGLRACHPPLCAARVLALHDVGHPLCPRRCDGPAARRQLVHHVGEGDAAIHVDNHTRAARAAPGTHLTFREQAITDAELDRYADHDVDSIALHFEDPVDRLRREEPDAIDLAATGHRRLEAGYRAGI